MHNALWKPATIGEVVFQRLYRHLTMSIEITHEATDLSFLVAPQRFRDFMHLAATLEIFMRTLRSVAEMYVEMPGASGQTYGRRVREDTDLPVSLISDSAFCSELRDLAPAAHLRRRNPGIEKNVLERSSRCYMCGIAVVDTGTGRDRATVDHIWPLRLGGVSIEENLDVACSDCNLKKGHAATWAWGPVQSTYEQVSESAALNSELRMSLVIARIMFTASTPQRRSTLKEAAARIWPAAARVSMPSGRPHVYFECLRGAEELG